MPNGWRTINSLVHKIRLHGRRGKGIAESFSRQKSRHAPQKEGGLKILCDLPLVWPRLVRPTNLMSRMDGKKTHTHTVLKMLLLSSFSLFQFIWFHEKKVRRACVKQMKRHKARFGLFYPENFSNHLANMKRPTVWGDELDIRWGSFFFFSYFEWQLWVRDFSIFTNTDSPDTVVVVVHYNSVIFIYNYNSCVSPVYSRPIPCLLSSAMEEVSDRSIEIYSPDAEDPIMSITIDFDAATVSLLTKNVILLILRFSNPVD